MKKVIPYVKLSKKDKQAENQKRRGSWGALSPVTRKPKNAKAYDRKKARDWSEDSTTAPFLFLNIHV